jgi:hypothetical protein
LGADLGPIWLLLLGHYHSRREQAVAQTIAAGGPGHTIIEHIGVDGAAWANLANLKPVSGDKSFDGCCHGVDVTAKNLGQCSLTNHHGVMIANLSGENVQ